MYLSKVRLHWEQTKNPYEQHRALWHLFPSRTTENRSFLYRVEHQPKGLPADLIMQSLQQPELSEAVELLATKPMNVGFHSGQQLRFRLRANPIKTIKDGSINDNTPNIRSVRVPLLGEEQQHTWLNRKLSEAALIEALTIQQELPLNFRKAREKRSGKIQPVLFEGIMSVQNPTTLLQLIQAGIGPAKSFGCGMLSVAAV